MAIKIPSALLAACRDVSITVDPSLMTTRVIGNSIRALQSGVTDARGIAHELVVAVFQASQLAYFIMSSCDRLYWHNLSPDNEAAWEKLQLVRTTWTLTGGEISAWNKKEFEERYAHGHQSAHWNRRSTDECPSKAKMKNLLYFNDPHRDQVVAPYVEALKARRVFKLPIRGHNNG